jgi:hypothetical protein
VDEIIEDIENTKILKTLLAQCGIVITPKNEEVTIRVLLGLSLRPIPSSLITVLSTEPATCLDEQASCRITHLQQIMDVVDTTVYATCLVTKSWVGDVCYDLRLAKRAGQPSCLTAIPFPDRTPGKYRCHYFHYVMPQTTKPNKRRSPMYVFPRGTRPH